MLEMESQLCCHKGWWVNAGKPKRSVRWRTRLTWSETRMSRWEITSPSSPFCLWSCYQTAKRMSLCLACVKSLSSRCWSFVSKRTLQHKCIFLGEKENRMWSKMFSTIKFSAFLSFVWWLSCRGTANQKQQCYNLLFWRLAFYFFLNWNI